jgi:hypothetical protein
VTSYQLTLRISQDWDIESKGFNAARNLSNLSFAVKPKVSRIMILLSHVFLPF